MFLVSDSKCLSSLIYHCCKMYHSNLHPSSICLLNVFYWHNFILDVLYWHNPMERNCVPFSLYFLLAVLKPKVITILLTLQIKYSSGSAYLMLERQVMIWD
uniref:Uncharacterized protein n=1 Tax=Rhizophora mucronata TaxID=61149 RepID=A0A2P2J4K1_RHIMU